MKVKPSSYFVALISIIFGAASLTQALHADTTTAALPQGVLSQNAAAISGALTSPDNQRIEIREIQGEIFLQKSGQKELQAITKNTRAEAGDVIHAKDGTCEIQFNNSKVVLYPNTDLEISEAAINKTQKTFATNLNLQSGRLKIHVDKLSEGSRFEVKTPTAVAAVRGTTFYIYSGVDLGKLFTELYVDESTKGVLLTHLKTLESFLIPHFASSFASEDGTLLAPNTLTPDEQKDFKEKWEKFLSKFLSQQLAIEEFSLLSSPPTNPNLSNLTSNDGFLTDDASVDKNSEQNAFGQSQSEGEGSSNEESPGLTEQEIIDQLNDLLQDSNNQLINLSENAGGAYLDLLELIRRSEGLKFLVAEHIAEEQNDFTFGKYYDFSSAEDFEWSYNTVNVYGDYGVVTEDRLTIFENLLDDPNVYTLPQSFIDGFETLQDKLQELIDAANSALSAADKQAVLDQAQVIVDEFGLNLEVSNAILEEFKAKLDQAKIDMEALRESERNEMRREIARIRQEIDFEQADARLEKIRDAQTGKVFTDIHGNRVRVDEYIYHEDSSNKVEVLALTLRTAGEFAGVSSTHLTVEFNRNFDEGFDIKTLPWNDYFNVVTGSELEERYYNYDNYDGEGYLQYSEGEFLPQYIVHATNPNLARGEGALYPTHFVAEFANPARQNGETEVQDKVRWDEAYGDPETVYFEGQSSPDGSYVIQGLVAHSILISPANDQSLLMYWEGNQYSPTVFLGSNVVYDYAGDSYSKYLYPNGGEEAYLLDYTQASGAQQPGLSNPSEDTSGRAYNSHTLVYLDSNENIHAKSFTGSFVPFDNDGNILNQEGGFEINGLRDLFSPNILVHNGRYNLEVMFSYNDFFDESPDKAFQIDTVITPEIFTSESGFNTSVDYSSEFPPYLAEVESPGQYDV